MKISALAVILTAFLAVNASAQTKAVYTGTSAKVCKPTKESSDGNYVGICPGVGGYKVEFLEGDLRQTLNVIAPSKKRSELNLWSSVSSGFSSIGEKIEWRVKGTAPQSFIVRFNASENPDDAAKITSYLVVVKVGKMGSCITDIVKPMKNQNEEARRLADSANGKACKVFE